MNSIIKKDNFIHYILSLLFVLFFIFLIPCNVNAAKLTATSGTCGDNVTWTFNPNSRELVISGTGNMTDYNSSNKSPFYGVTNINSVKINNGVTSIGENAFYDTSFLYNIEIPTSVTTIGAAAFASTSLLEINIPASVTNIANSAFSGGNRKTNNITVDPNNPIYDSRNNCNALIETATNTLLFGCKNTIIPNSVTSIGDYAFASNYDLSSIVIPGSVKKIGKDAFHCCYELEAVTISEGVENIDEDAFDHCYKITSITIPSSVESIGYDAFEGCSGLTSVTLSNGIKSIGNGAFKDCTSLTSITIPNSVTSIGLGVFRGSNDININVSSNNPVYDSRNNCNGIIETATNTLIIGNGKTQIPNSVTSIGEEAFYYCTSLTSITIPGSVESIGERAFGYCESLTSVTIPGSIECIDKGAFLSCTALESVTIPNSQIKIAKSAFEKTKLFNSLEFDSNGFKIYNNILFDCDKSKTNITIPNNVVNYAYNLFSSSTYSNLTTLTLSNKIKKIWDESFCGCPKLESITIPSGVESIGDKAFYNRKLLTSITIPGSVESIGEYAFFGCSGLTSVTLSNGIKNIGNSAFSYCESLTSVTLSNCIKSIGDSAFLSCTALESITIPNSVTSIGNGAFGSCTSLTSITIPNSVTSIGYSVFNNCESLTSVTLSNGIKSIDKRTFHYCKSLISITIPSSVESIGEMAFGGCESLTSVTLSNGIKSIGNSAFDSCKSLTSITIPNSVTSIGDRAFYYCESVASITIPSSVTSIGDRAFYYCLNKKYNKTTGYIITNGEIVMGSAYASAYNLSNYTVGQEIKVQRNINDTEFIAVDDVSNKTYNGSAFTPSVTVKDENITLTKDTDYTVSYSNNTNAGTATITITGKGKFGGSRTKTFTINKANITPSVSISNWTYGNTASNPSVLGNSGNGTVTYTYTGTVNGGTSNGYNSTTKPTNAGSYKVTASVAASNNYNGGSCEKTFTINRANISPSVTMSDWTYGSTASNPSVSGNTGNGTVTYTYKGTVNGGANNGYNSSTKPTNAGSYTVTASIPQTNNYNSNTCSKAFTINRANLNPSVSISDWTYNGTANIPSVSGNTGNGTITYNYTGTVNGGTNNGYSSSNKPTNAGSYKVTATIAQTNNYNGSSCNKTFTINRANLSLNLTMSDWTYGNTASNPVLAGNIGNGNVTYTYSGTVNGNTQYASTSTKPANAGNYKITAAVSQTNNYNSSNIEKDFIINRADINPTVSLTGWMYNKTPNNPSVAGNTGNGAVTYTYTVKDANNYSDNKPINAGNYTVKAAIAQTNNYNVAQCVTNFTIEKANVSLSVSLEDWIYGQNPNIPVTLGIMENAAITYTYKSAAAADSEYSTDIPQNAGEYTIKATSAATSNYNEGYSTNTFTILKANITPTVSLTGWTYNDDANTPTVSGNSGNGTVSYSYTIKNADDYKTTVPENAGNYTLKCVISETSNYNGATCCCDFSIAKASLDLTIALDDWVYNTTPSIPQTTGNNGNGEESIEYKTLDAEDDEYSEEIPVNAGNYMVRYSVAETNNYNSGLITNTFKIEKANLDLSISIEDWIYKENANTPVKSGNISNGEESITYKEKTADTYGEEVPTNAGTYIIKYFVAETANYNEAETTYEFKIKKAQPNLKVSLENWVYSYPSPNPVKSGNLENGTEIIEYKAKGAEDDTYDETKPYDAGEYTIRYTVLETANYNKCITTNDFVIKKKEPVISVSLQNWTYGENPKTPVITNNIENGTVAYSYKLLDAKDYSDEVPVNAGKYTIKAIINETNNYTAKTLFSNFIIYKADIHPEISINDWTYGEDAKQPILSGNLGNGKEKIEYKLKTQNDADYNTQIPVNAGEYTAHYLIEESDNYNSGESTCDFNINKAPIAAVINVKDKITYNEKYDVTATIKNANNNEEIKDINNIVFTYKKKAEEEYTNNKPINVGIYNVKVDVAESNNYLTTSSTSSFEIIKADINPILVLNDWTYNDKDIPTPQVTGCFEDNNIEYAYKTKDAYDDTYHEEVPVNAGEYTVRAIISDSDNYNGKTITSNFKINKANPQLSLNIKDWAYKENPNAPTLSGNIENAKCIYSYKLKTADDTTYDENIPVDAGKYTIRANTEETTNYNSASVTKDFEILGITNNAPSIAINDKYMVSIKAGEIKNDTLDYIEYKLNDGDWTKYTDSFPVYKQYDIKARQIAKRSQIISEQADVSGEEKPSGITAEYNGDNLFVGDKVSLEDIDVTVHYFNSQDEVTNDFYLDNDTIEAVGDNTITIRFKEYSDNVTVIGKRQTVIFKNRLLYADGTPMKNKKVCFIGENGEIYWAITDEDGYYTIENFKTGKYTFKVYDGDTVLCSKETIVDGLSETEDVVGETTTSIYSTATLSGIFKYSDSSFVSNAEIVLIDKKTQKEVAKTNIDDKGYYSFENIPFGDYIIKVYVNNVLISSEDVTVDGKTSSITYNKSFKNSVMKLQNRLTYADGSPMSNVEVKLYNEKGELIAIVKTDENGYYEFPDIPIGEYIIKACKDDIEIYKADITITGEDVIFSGNQIDDTPINQQNEDSNNNIPETSDRNVNNNQTDGSNSVDLPEQPTLSEFNSTNKKTFKQTLNSYKPEIKKVKVINKNKIKITIKNITGPITNYKEIKNIKYQIQLADNKKMKKSKKYVTKNTKYTIKKKNLAKKTYYLRVRLVYREKGSIKRCSKWSKVKKVVVK